jgi:hypothetical protein
METVLFSGGTNHTKARGEVVFKFWRKVPYFQVKYKSNYSSRCRQNERDTALENSGNYDIACNKRDTTLENSGSYNIACNKRDTALQNSSNYDIACNKCDTALENSGNCDIACNKYCTVVCYVYVVHNLLEIWTKCEDLRIITELKWLRTGFLQNRSYGNYSFIDVIGEKSNICGIKKKGKKEGRKKGRKDTRIM